MISLSIYCPHSLALYILLLIPICSATCYRPNGTSEPSTEYQPCSNYQGESSMCCATNRGNPSGGPRSNGYTNDICLDNGLCLNIISTEYQGETEVKYAYFREQCRSSNWGGGDCVDVCTGGTMDDNDNSEMTPCSNTSDSTTWCCGRNNTDCCNTPNAIALAQNFGVQGSTATSSVSPSSATPITASATSSPQPTSQTSSLSTGAKAGIGVGVAVGAVGLLGLILLLLRRWNRKANVNLTNASGPYSMQPVLQNHDHSIPSEMSAAPTTAKHELQGDFPRYG